MPPLPRRTKWHNVKDCQIRELLTDPEGGSPTLGDWTDVPGIKTVGVGGTVETQTLTGDGVTLDSETQLTGVSVSLAHAKISLDVLAIILGATVTEAGTTPSQTTMLRMLADDELPYWELRAKTKGTDFKPGEGHLVLPKCKINTFPDIGFLERDYRTFSSGAVCLPRLSDGAWLDLIFTEEPVEIEEVA